MPSVLGIDVSTHAIDLVRLDEDTDRAEWTHRPLIGATAFERLRAVRFAMPYASFYDDVYLAAIETPRTRFLKSAGALFPVYGAVVACLPGRLELWPLLPQEWRAGIGLPGNATKEQCGDAVRALMLEQLPDIKRSQHRANAFTWPQDALDAYACAYTARNINQRGIEAA